MPAEPTRPDPAGDAAAAALPHAAPGIAAGQALARAARASAVQATQPLHIGAVKLGNRLLLAPMAGVTDRPFRSLCRRLGAGLAVSEMVSSNPALAASRKSRERMDHRGEPAPIAVQIAGSDPGWMADAARANVDHGAQIIDINLGCPARKVCKTAAGSALLRDEPLVGRILAAVVAAVPVPVTLKTRTGWSPETRNLSRIAHIARESGIVMLTVHGRTRACGYGGRAEFDSLRALRADATLGNDLLLAANGDIDSPERAHAVLEFTGADALMIGRAAQGRPWLFQEIGHYLATGEHLPPPSADWVRATLLGHLEALYGFYGATRGVRIARKHIGWYLRARAPATAADQRNDEHLARINRAETPQQQTALVRGLFDGPATLEDAA